LALRVVDSIVFFSVEKWRLRSRAEKGGIMGEDHIE